MSRDWRALPYSFRVVMYLLSQLICFGNIRRHGIIVGSDQKTMFKLVNATET